MGRVVLAFALAYGMLGGWTGCASERAETWERYRSSFARLYPIAWGSAPSDEALGESQRRFDCMWERLEHPADEFGCAIRGTDETVRCSEDPAMRGNTVDCLRPERRACAPSRAFERASWDCAGERERRRMTRP